MKSNLHRLISLSVFALLGYHNELSQVLVEARRTGMMNGEYLFITVDFETDKSWEYEDWMKGYNLSAAFTGFLDLGVQLPIANGKEEFDQEVRRRMADPPFSYPMNPDEQV